MDKKERLTYLMNWKDGLWIQIRQKEDAIWRFISFYSASVIVLLGLVYNSESPLTTSQIYMLLGAVAIITSIGILIIFDANFWLNHNLHLIGVVERELLSPNDFDRIIPASYSHPDFKISKSYSIQLMLMLITLVPILFISINNVYSNLFGIFSQILGLLLASLWCFIIYRCFEYQQIFWNAVKVSLGNDYDRFEIDREKNNLSLRMENIIYYGLWGLFYLIMFFEILVISKIATTNIFTGCCLESSSLILLFILLLAFVDQLLHFIDSVKIKRIKSMPIAEQMSKYKTLFVHSKVFTNIKISIFALVNIALLYLTITMYL